MKIHIANYEPERMGGGWTFARYLYEGLECVTYDESDIYFITSASMVERSQAEMAQADGKRIVLRVDNALRNSRNRGTGMTRLKDFAQMADLVIYQSKWARSFLEPFLCVSGPVVLNGTDLSKFNATGRENAPDSYLYARSSRDEGKGWINAWYYFVNNKGTLDIVGKFSGENLEYNFDFYNNERFTFWGEVSDMAPFYKKNKYLLYSFWNDACSNTLIEARASGMEIIDVDGALQTGGAPEIMQCKDLSKERMIQEYKELLSNF